MTKKDLVGGAVRVYLELRRTELREAMLAKLRRLDGSVKSSVSLLTGISPERHRPAGWHQRGLTLLWLRGRACRT